jgi:FtsH-binding integral membrane protein
VSKPEIQLRLVQAACVVMVLASIGVSLGVQRTPHGIMSVHWLMIVLAIWSAVSGFTLQRRIVNGPDRSQRRPKKSTPFTRWRAGNLARLSSAMSVGLWGLVLCEFGGPAWLVNTFFAIGLLLLLIWRPGASPAATQP